MVENKAHLNIARSTFQNKREDVIKYLTVRWKYLNLEV